MTDSIQQARLSDLWAQAIEAKRQALDLIAQMEPDPTKRAEIIAKYEAEEQQLLAKHGR